MKKAFSLVEILVALIIVSLITAALAPVITKKLSSSGITIGGGGGGGVPSAGACAAGQYFDMDEQTCKHCPEGHFCDGFNKLVCLAGTSTSADGTDKHPLNGQSQCKECADGYYALEASPTCLLNTAKNCAERSKIDNICTACSGEDLLVDGNCVKDVPVYTLLNPSGTDITEASTEFEKGSTYWTLKIKATGTLTFSSVPSNVVDVFMVGGGGGGQYSSDGCGNYAAGGGSYNIISNLIVEMDTAYPITIGAGASATKCARGTGGTTSAFGTFSYGGVNDGNHAICPFNDATCDRKYGETGNNSNQIANTGNGGKAQSAGMSGVVIIRGLLGAKNAAKDTIPSFKYLKDGVDATYSHATLSISDTYWFLKFASSGTVSFNSLPNNFIDVFVVGGGAGGQYSSDGCGNYAAGGGNYSIVNNVAISPNTTYKVEIGNGGKATQCGIPNGETSSGFGVFSHGGVNKGSHSICQFNDASCSFTYGNVGSNTNQNHNTGNGGTTQKPGMSGVVIIRGKRSPSSFNYSLPDYKFTNNAGSDVTTEKTTLSISETHWFLRFTSDGSVSFSSLPNNFIDVFVVGGGAGGKYSSDGCGNAAAGGGNYNIVNNVAISTGLTYPIDIGNGGKATQCGFSNGETSSGFGVFSHGGVNQGSHSICQFNDASCSFKYGNVGSDTNQNHNTGNGGTSQKPGMSGIVLIRGKLGNTNANFNLPTYKFLSGSGVDSTTAYTTLNVVDDYWYLKFTLTGSVIFDYLPTNFVDVFVVGGGAGGQYSSDGCGNYAAGGGTFNVSKDVYISKEMTYPLVVGAGGSAGKCSLPEGATSSGFGVYSRGGLKTASYGICQFGDSSCAFKYGNTGNDTNQNHNTGNGGTLQRGGMNGTVIIRGKMNNSLESVLNKLPTYRYKDSGGSDITYSGSTLSVTNTHWYLKFTKSGELVFDSIKNNKIDVFVVGGGAGGQYSSDGCGNYAAGGGNYVVSAYEPIQLGTPYKITVGKGASAGRCSRPAGNPSSAFGITAQGGSGGTAHSVCMFSGSDCSITYGNSGTNTNQFQNTGNGGTEQKNGMDGTVIIRGAL